MGLYPEEMGPFIFASLIKDIVKKYGITQLDALLSQVPILTLFSWFISSHVKENEKEIIVHYLCLLTQGIFCSSDLFYL